MSATGIIVLLIMAATILVSAKGFKSSDFMARYDFQVEKILLYKDYKRLFTAAFLHVNWLHLIFNMLALFFFASTLSNLIGLLGFLAVYIGGIAGGNLFALFIQKHNSSYNTVGASGGVLAIMLACIALVPGMTIHLFFVPVPGWLLGIAYVLISIYGIRSRKEGISHEAHLGGGILGILLAILFQPSSLQTNLWVILLLLIPSLAFAGLLIRYPHYLVIGSIRPRNNFTLEDRTNIERRITEAQVDEILEKINTKGIKSLSRKERETLDRYSKP